MTEAELTHMLQEIAYTQARLYYKREEVPQPPIVVRSVFMLILAIVTIQFARAGVDVQNLQGVPEEIVSEMELAGWNVSSIIEEFNIGKE